MLEADYGAEAICREGAECLYKILKPIEIRRGYRVVGEVYCLHGRGAHEAQRRKPDPTDHDK